MSADRPSPRNDYVVVKRVLLGETPQGIALPDHSFEGLKHTVVAIGPDVENLEEGDEVLVMGSLGHDYAFLPNSKDMFFTKESNIVIVFKVDE